MISSGNDIWNRFQAMLARHAPQLLAALRPPAAPERIQAAEAAMGLQLPQDVRRAYLRHDGTLSGNRQMPHYEAEHNKLFEPFNWWASLDEVVSEYMHLKKYHDRRRVSASELYPESDPYWDELLVKPVGGNDKWIPIGLSSTTTIIYVDLDPAGKGVVGQIIKDDYMCEPSCRAESFDAYLQSLVDRVGRGELVYDDGWQTVHQPKTR